MTYLEQIKTSFLEDWSEFINQVPNYIIAIIIIIIGTMLAGWISRGFRKTVGKSSGDPLITNFLTKTLKVGIIILVILFALNAAGLQSIATGLLTAAGASAVIIGFAFKDIGENFISGVILSFNRPFNVNDTVSIGDIFGKIKSMEFRYTKLKTFDGRDVYIPNSDIIKKPVYNYTEDGYFRLDFLVGIDYEDDTTAARKLILEAINKTVGVIKEQGYEAFITVDELATSTVNLKAFFWVKTIDYKRKSHEVRSAVIVNVKKVIMENGLSMPADIHEVKLYGSQKNIPIILKKEEEA